MTEPTLRAKRSEDPPLSKLESGKAKRRGQILDAAHDLLKTRDASELSMRELADRAGVSLATPYNLFGSKQSVLLALLVRESGIFYGHFEKRASKDPIQRIFQFVDNAFELYSGYAKFFARLLSTLFIVDPELQQKLQQNLLNPIYVYLKRLLREAVAERRLATDISLELASRQMIGISLHFVQEWTVGAVSLDRARRETEFGNCLLLLALAKGETKGKLLARNLELETLISHL